MTVDELTERIPGPCGVHPSADLVGDDVAAWAARYRLPTGAAFHRLAARVFPDGPVRAPTLFAKWITWIYAFDDWCDEGSASRTPDALDAMGVQLTTALRTGHSPSREPLAAAFADLWRATAPGMSPAWCRRFGARLAGQLEACRRQSVNRAVGRAPAPSEYPALRRAAGGGVLFDLVEACLRAEVPGKVKAGTIWRTLVDSCADVFCWCNDVASLRKEQGDPHNYVLVAGEGLGVPDPADWVADRVVERAEDMRDAACALPDELPGQVVHTLLGMPRAHLEWLLESDRYKST